MHVNNGSSDAMNDSMSDAMSDAMNDSTSDSMSDGDCDHENDDRHGWWRVRFQTALLHVSLHYLPVECWQAPLFSDGNDRRHCCFRYGNDRRRHDDGCFHHERVQSMMKMMKMKMQTQKLPPMVLCAMTSSVHHRHLDASSAPDEFAQWQKQPLQRA
jgi:hypothetical protein